MLIMANILRYEPFKIHLKNRPSNPNNWALDIRNWSYLRD